MNNPNWITPYIGQKVDMNKLSSFKDDMDGMWHLSSNRWQTSFTSSEFYMSRIRVRLHVAYGKIKSISATEFVAYVHPPVAKVGQVENSPTLSAQDIATAKKRIDAILLKDEVNS